MPARPILLIDPNDFQKRAFVDPGDEVHLGRLKANGLKPLAEVDAATRKKIATSRNLKDSSPEALTAALYEAAKPRRREKPAHSPPPLRYTGRPTPKAKK